MHSEEGDEGWSRAAACAEAVEQLAQRCRPGGLDLFAGLNTERYDRALPQLAPLAQAGEGGRLAIVVGNSRSLWPLFVAAYRRSPSLREVEHPLNTYVESVLGEAVVALPWVREVRFSHTTGPSLVGIQRAAELAGLAWVSPSHLSIHPRLGPWLALRAVVVTDLEGPEEPPRPLSRPCAACDQACAPAFRVALEDLPPGPGGLARVRARWETWLAVRDACPLGRAFRYTEPQVRYHYTGDRRWIQQEPESGSSRETSSGPQSALESGGRGSSGG